MESTPLKKTLKDFYVVQVSFFLRNNFRENISHVWSYVVMIAPWYPFSGFYFRENEDCNMPLPDGFFAAILTLGLESGVFPLV